MRRGCAGYLFEAAQQNSLWMTSADQPVLGVDWSLFYWKYRIPGEGEAQLRGVAERIKEVARAQGSRAFIPVYGGSPSDFARIASYLSPDEFLVVGLDEMVEAARRAGPARDPVVAPVRPPVAKAFCGRVVAAARGDFSGDSVALDLVAHGVGQMRARLRFAWDERVLRIRVEETTGPGQPCESRQQAGYAAGEFDLSDGVALWFDFDLDGTREHGDYTLWLGFSSQQRRDLWCCTVNDRVLSGVYPEIAVSTGGQVGARTIEAVIAWAELERWLETRFQPEPRLGACGRVGFTFACQPLLVEGRGGRAFLNGRSNRRENETAAVLEDQRERALLPMPDGFDAHSLRVRLT